MPVGQSLIGMVTVTGNDWPGESVPFGGLKEIPGKLLLVVHLSMP